MPVIAPGSLVLVTGATGYIGCWIVRALLDSPNSYHVRAAVRSSAKGDSLKRVFSKEAEGGRFEIAVAGDISADGAFDDAVKGVAGIVHTASPVTLDVDDPQEIIGPAVAGTLGILESSVKHASETMKRVIVLSSVAALPMVPNEGQASITVNEELWNDAVVSDVEENGRKVAPMVKYAASKTLAERAAIKFWNDHKTRVGWDLVTINPPFVLGPVIHELSNSSELSSSSAILYQILCKPDTPGGMPQEVLTRGHISWVDVRDLADAHVRALEREEASGERIIVSASNFTWQQCVDIVHSPSSVSSEGGMKHAVIYDTSKLVSVLGMSKLRGIEESVKDTYEDFRRRGW